jgi:hypothetical protein
MAKTLDRPSTAKVRNAKPGLYPDGLYPHVALAKDSSLNKSWLFSFAF